MTTKAQINCVLGFDFGHRKIGVATGQTITGTATALETVPATDPAKAWARLEQLVREWRPEKLIVGLPLTLDGEAQPASKGAQRFARELAERFGLPVEMCDERLTTREARTRFKALRRAGAARKKHAGIVDAIAAQLIVETWLAGQHYEPDFSADGDP